MTHFDKLKRGDFSTGKAFVIFSLIPYLASFLILPFLASMIKVTFNLAHSTAMLFWIAMLVLLLLYEIYVTTILWKQSDVLQNVLLKFLLKAIMLFIIFSIASNIYYQTTSYFGLKMLESRLQYKY